MALDGKIGDSFRSRLKRKIQYSLFRQKWNIGITPYNGVDVAGLNGHLIQDKSLNEVQWMCEAANAFAADPFVIPSVSSDSALNIFYEHFDWSDGIGRIDKVIYEKNEFSYPTIVLDSKFHLSYPFVYKEDGEYLLLPEHSASKNVSIYRLDGDGNIRSKSTVGDHLEWVDSTLLYWNEKFWIFATHAGQNDNTELYIYFATDLNGPWSMHAQNPVKIDRSNARPAGQFISHMGDIFRPAQDCTAHYGSGIIINRLDVLTEDEFSEYPVSEIRPRRNDRYDYGLHTISSVNGYTVIDGARMESVFTPHLDRFAKHFRS